MDIDELEMNDLYNEKQEITQNTLPRLLSELTEKTNQIKFCTDLQQPYVVELINLETKGYHGDDEIAYASQYHSGVLLGVSHKPLEKARRMYSPAVGGRILSSPPDDIPRTMTKEFVRCRERWVQNQIRNIQIKKEQLLISVEEVKEEQTRTINNLRQITIRIQQEEDPEYQEDEGEEEDQEDEDEGEEEDQEDEDEGEDQDEEEEDDEYQDEMESDEEIIHQNIMNDLEC